MRSQIDYAKAEADEPLQVGDEGTVVGQDEEKHVCVDFGSNKGRLDFELPAFALEQVPLAGGFMKGDCARCWFGVGFIYLFKLSLINLSL